MSELKPKIIATTPEEFKEISDKLATLPECIRKQIETAQKIPIGNGIQCEIRYLYRTDLQTICLPKTSSIKDFGHSIYCYCGELIFVIGENIKKYPIEYIFIDNNKEEKP